MKTTEINESLHWLLIRVYLKAKHNLIKIAEEHGFTVMQVFTLFILEPGKQMPMNAISGTPQLRPLQRHRYR